MTVTTTATIEVPAPRNPPAEGHADTCGTCGLRVALTDLAPHPSCDADTEHCGDCRDTHILGCAECAVEARFDDWME